MEGESQAGRLRDFLAGWPIEAIISSEYRRAWQSAAPLAEGLGLHVRRDTRLNERILSAEPIANWREILRDSFEIPDLRGPGGETAREVSNRAWGVLNELLDRHELTAAVSHGNLISLVLHSIDPTFGFDGWASLSNPDVYMLARSDAGAFGFCRIWPEEYR